VTVWQDLFLQLLFDGSDCTRSALYYGLLASLYHAYLSQQLNHSL